MVRPDHRSTRQRVSSSNNANTGSEIPTTTTNINTSNSNRNPNSSSVGGSSSSSNALFVITPHTIITLMIGITIGYVIIPFMMISHLGDQDRSNNSRDFFLSEIKKTRMGTIESKIPLSSPQDTQTYKQTKMTEFYRQPLVVSPPSIPLTITNPSQIQNVQNNFELLASQSLPTSATPYVMMTAKLPDQKRRKILVTGGAGFVGSHLVDKLMMEGHEVIVLDNFFTGQKRNIEHWMHHPNFSLVVHDVTEPIYLEIDEIYHLACPASPPHYQYNPVKTIKTSTMGTINMLGLAKRVRARMLLTSTSEIYGDPLQHPQKESYWGNVNTIGPRSCYDEGKRVAETMMYSYRDQNGVEVRVARIFNTFGPRMHPNDGRVVSNFIIQALQDKPLTIYGSGEQTRSFQYVSDLVDGLHKLMNSDYDQPVNLGNPDEYSVKDFAEYIKSLTKSKSRIDFLPKSRDDPHQRKPDINIAQKKIGWKPKVLVKDGLEKTIEYFTGVLKDSGEIIPTGPGAAKPEA